MNTEKAIGKTYSTEAEIRDARKQRTHIAFAFYLRTLIDTLARGIVGLEDVEIRWTNARRKAKIRAPRVRYPHGKANRKSIFFIDERMTGKNVVVHLMECLAKVKVRAEGNQGNGLKEARESIGLAGKASNPLLTDDAAKVVAAIVAASPEFPAATYEADPKRKEDGDDVRNWRIDFVDVAGQTWNAGIKGTLEHARAFCTMIETASEKRIKATVLVKGENGDGDARKRNGRKVTRVTAATGSESAKPRKVTRKSSETNGETKKAA